MYFWRNAEISARSAKMKRDAFFCYMFVCCAAFLRFHFSLWMFVLSCYVELLSCLLFFVVLPVSFCNDLSHPRSLLTSFRLVLVWSRLALICHVLFCSCRFRLLLRVAFSFRFLRVVFCKSVVLSAALLYESPRRKLGWRLTAGSPYCSAVIGRLQGSAKIDNFRCVFCLFR